MRLFGKKKDSEAKETIHEIFGGCAVRKNQAGYEITWRSPHITTVTVSSPPTIDDDVQTKRNGDETQVLSTDCKLKIVTREGDKEAHISRI